MEPTGQLAPPVVAVMVVHDPGPWFEQALDALAAQDYANLKSLFLVTGDPTEVTERIRARVPHAFVRAVTGNPGYGAAANEVQRLVEGENGFFCFLHDDVALDHGAIRLLVEEMYRSNAGIVGPKLVTWDDPTVLQHVGLGVDRFGEVDPIVEPGEFDQEQHDAVRDVFALPSACLLIRADLYRAIGGFDPAIEYHGDDVDLCWRAHLGGARVVVVPAARARHLEALRERRPDLPHESLAAKSRMRSVATLTGARRLLLLSFQLVLITLAESIVSLFSGRFREVRARLGALFGMVARAPQFFARRRSVARLREVPDPEVAGLQLRGSARLTRYLRARDSRMTDIHSTTERRWRQTAGSAPALAWMAVLAVMAIGSRSILTGGVPRFGQFLEFPASPADLLGHYRTGWVDHGLGSQAAAPTGLAIIAVGSIGTLFHMGLAHTVAVLGLFLAGALGMWRLTTIFPTARARITGLVVYVAVPLPTQLLAAGRWSALACYAALPWALHLLRRIAGIETSGVTVGDDAEPVVAVAGRTLIRLFAQLCLLAAVVFAFAPAFALVLLLMGLVIALATVVTSESFRVALFVGGAAAGAALVAVVVNLPWATSVFGGDGWTAVVGVPSVEPRRLGLSRLAGFGIGREEHSPLSLALLVPVVAAPLVARAWRFSWAIRGAALVSGFGLLAYLDDRGSLPVRMPEPGVLLVPVALGIALGAACLAAAFQDDVLAGSFGWRQPLGLLSAAAIAIGVLPGVFTAASGRWDMPRRTLLTLVDQFPTDPEEGDYRMLWVGDPRVLPAAAWTYQPGIGYAITDDGAVTVEDGWGRGPTAVEREVADSLRQMANGLTLRGGRLLAQYGIRYVIVPLADGAAGTITAPVAAPAGLIDVLEDQLDLSSPLTSPPNYAVYENTAFTPTRSVLTAGGAAASRQAGGAVLAQADLRGSVPFAVGAPLTATATGDIAAGTLHVAVPFDSNWSLTVDGEAVPARRAFGSTLAFDVATAGRAVLRYDTPVSRPLWLVLQLLLWVGLVLAASRLQPRSLRRVRPRLADATPVADLTEPISSLDADELPWADAVAGGDQT